MLVRNAGPGAGRALDADPPAARRAGTEPGSAPPATGSASNAPVTGDLASKKSLESLSQRRGFLRPTERVCRSGIGPEPEDTMTLYIIDLLSEFPYLGPPHNA